MDDVGGGEGRGGVEVVRVETVYCPDSQVNPVDVVVGEIHRDVLLHDGAVTATEPPGDLVVAQVQSPQLIKVYLNVSAHRESRDFVV